MIKLTDIFEVGEGRASLLRDIGISSVSELLKETPVSLWEKILAHSNGKIYFQNECVVKKIYFSALAQTKNKIFLMNPDFVPVRFTENDAIFDMEYNTDIYPNHVFAISVGFLEKKKASKEFIVNTFFDDYSDAEKRNEIVKEFFTFVRKRNFKRLIGWGITSAELPLLKNIHPWPPYISILDLYTHISENIAFPIKTRRLKDVSDYLFGTKERKISSGLEAFLYYQRYLYSRDQAIKSWLIEYNQADVLVVHAILSWLHDFMENSNTLNNGFIEH